MSSCCYGARSGKTKKATERTKENQCLSFSYLQEAETARRGQSTNITQPPGSVQGRVRRRRGDWNHHNLEKLSWLLRSKFVKCFIQTSRHQLQSPHLGLILQELKRPKWHDPTTAPAPLLVSALQVQAPGLVLAWAARPYTTVGCNQAAQREQTAHCPLSKLHVKCRKHSALTRTSPCCSTVGSTFLQRFRKQPVAPTWFSSWNRGCRKSFSAAPLQQHRASAKLRFLFLSQVQHWPQPSSK